MDPSALTLAANASPRSPGRRISFTPGIFFAPLTRSVTAAARLELVLTQQVGVDGYYELPQFFSDLIRYCGATRGPARSSTMSARLLDL